MEEPVIPLDPLKVDPTHRGLDLHLKERAEQKPYLIDPPMMDPNRRSPSLIEKIASLMALAEVALEKAIETAEGFVETRGAGRKAFAIEQTMRAVRRAEARHDLLPAVVERVVFAALEIVLEHFVFDRVFAALERRGVINSHKAAP